MATISAPAVAVSPAASVQSTDAAAQGTAKGLVGQGAQPQSLGLGQNPFTAAANNVDQQKAAMLSAIANGGSAGRAVLDQANANAQAMRQAAIQGALTASATRGVGAGLGAAAPGMQQAITNEVGLPGLLTSQNLGSAAAQSALSDKFLENGYAQYANEAKEAVPVMAQQTANMLNARRADAFNKLASSYQAAVDRAAQTGQTAQLNQAIKNIDLQIAQDNASAAGSRADAAASRASGYGPTATGYKALNADYGAPMAKAASALGYTPQDISTFQGHDGGQSFADLFSTAQAWANQGMTPAQVSAGLKGYSNKTYRNGHPEAVQLIVSTLMNSGDFAKAPAQPPQVTP